MPFFSVEKNTGVWEWMRTLTQTSLSTGEQYEVLIVASRWAGSRYKNAKVTLYPQEKKNMSICLHYWEFSLTPISESLHHYHLPFYFGFYQILTSMPALISSARRLTSSSMSLPSFKVFSVCRLPLSIASFFFCSTEWTKHQNAFGENPGKPCAPDFPLLSHKDVANKAGHVDNEAR